MTLDDLRVFALVCDQGSFSAVARALGCTQPAVSQHVARLERELGVSLFDRRTKGVVPTDAGTVLRVASREALATLDRAVENIEARREGGAGSLVITTGGTTVRHFMTGTVAKYQRLYPNIRIRFQAATSSAQCLEMLRTEPVDLAFVTIVPSVEAISQRAVMEIDYVLLTRADSPLASRSALSVEDLARIPCIALSERATSRSQLSQSLMRSGVSVEATMTVYDWDTAIDLVELGLGSAIVPSWHAHASVQRAPVVAIPIHGVDPIRVGWATRKHGTLLGPPHAFMAMMADELRALDPVPGVRIL